MSKERKAALRLAIAHIAPYVLRGDSLESIRRGQSGSRGSDGHIQIGGYVDQPGTAQLRKLKADDICVTCMRHTSCFEIFSLAQLYSFIKDVRAGV